MPPLRTALLAMLAATTLGAPAYAVLVRDHRNASVQGDLFEADPGFVVDIAIPLVKSRPVVFQTGDLSPGGDPVLHLLAPGAGTSGPVREVAMDDDSGGQLNARLRFTPTATGSFRLILHATSTGGRGTCSLRQDGRLLFGSVPFGGVLRRYQGLRRGETLSTVPLPNGTADFPALYLLSTIGRMLRRHTGSIFAATTLDQNIAAVEVLVGKWVPLPPAGPLRVVRNDARLDGHDADGDGLGRELELSAGTCSAATEIRAGWECGRSADLRDTDGDGLSDADELLGRMDDHSPAPFLLLPRWGADPRHKDLFIEVDYGRRDTSDPDSRMTPAVAREMAAAYAESKLALTPIEALLHAQRLGNPDALPGVRLHLDTGVPPEQPRDATIYGDWGGHNAVPPVCDPNGCHALPVADAYLSQMNAARKGVFHYTSSYIGSGGQCGVGIACSWSHTDPTTAIHEFGHTLTLNHGGPNSTLPEANCKVSYPSVMSYAFRPPQPFTFSDGFGRPGFNNLGVAEIGAVARPAEARRRALLERLRDVYGYTVDVEAGDVDWNRDGIFQPGAVAAYTNSFPDSGCEFTSSNRIPLEPATLHAPALARFGGRVFLFYRTAEDRLEVLVSNVDPFHCPPGGAPGCGNTAFTRFTIDQPWNRGVVALAAQALVEGEVPKLFVLFTDGAGALFQTTLTTLNGPPAFASPTPVPTTKPVFEEISTTGAAGHLFLAFKDAGGKIVLKQRAKGIWGPEIPVLFSRIVGFPPVPAGASPAIFETPDGTLFGAFPKADAGQGPGLQIWRFNPASGLWADPGFLDLPANILGRPALAFRALPPGAALAGRLFLYWIPRQSDGQPGVLRENWLVRSPAGKIDMSFSMQHSNAFFAAHGVAALSDPGVDDNVRLAVAFVVPSSDKGTPDGALEVRPKADGIVDLLQVDRDDWEAMGLGLCQVLVHEQASEPIHCPA